MRGPADPGELPGADVAKTVIVPLGLPGLGPALFHLGVILAELMFNAKVAPARFLASEGVVAEQFGEFEEVGDPARLFEFLVEFPPGSRDAHVVPELVADLGNPGEGLLQSRSGAGHAALVPDEETEFAVE